MTRNRSIAAFVLAGILVGTVLYNTRTPNEPTYQGRRISQWLAQLNSAISHNDFEKRNDPGKAIQAIGAKAAPYIVAEVRKANSAWAKNYRSFLPKLPRWLQRITPSPREEFSLVSASSALLAIGPSAKPALITALKDGEPVVRLASASALGSLAHYYGADIRDAVPALTECLRDPDANVRCASAIALGYVGSDAAAAVPGLIALLKDPQVGSQPGSRVFVRSAAARTLGKIGPQAKSALPALRFALNNAEPYDRSIAAIAICRIDSDITNTLPVLLEELKLIPDGSKWELLEAMQEMGPKAKDAFPALLDQLGLQGTRNAPSRFTLQKITNALVRIDPDAAARAGVHLPPADPPRR